MRRKLAIIPSGGGMTCSYTAGVIYALTKKYKLTNPDLVITGSGSAGTLAYYTAKQYESIKNIWTNLLSTKKFVNPYRFWKIIDIDYLIDDVFQKQVPLDIKSIKESKIQFFVSTTDYNTGELQYFSNRENVDFFKLLKATKAMPLAYNKPVYLNEKRYCDTSKSSSPYVHIQKALEEDATEILLIDTTTEKNIVTQLGFNTWLKLRSNKFRENYENIIERTDFKENLFIIKPKEELQITTLDHNKKLLTETFAQGYKEMMENRDFQKVFNQYC